MIIRTLIYNVKVKKKYFDHRFTLFVNLRPKLYI